MTETQLSDLLSLLKIDLGIVSEAYDSRLKSVIQAAAKFITTEGVTLDYTALDDVQLVVMYAGWMWRKRETGDGMPRMLRWALNNRIFSEKMQQEG